MKNLSYFLGTCPTHIKNTFIYINFNIFDKILLQNETSNYVYIIKKGRAKVYSLTTSGVKYLEHIHCEYEFFGELEVFLNKPILSYVEALEACEVIKISKDSLFKWLKFDSDFSLYMNIQLARKMYDTCVNTKANILYSLKYRVLFFLWRFSNEHNLDAIHKDIVVEGVGSNIRSVNRVIKELSSDDIIEYDKGFIRVKDFDKLFDIINNYL